MKKVKSKDNLPVIPNITKYSGTLNGLVFQKNGYIRIVKHIKRKN